MLPKTECQNSHYEAAQRYKYVEIKFQELNIFSRSYKKKILEIMHIEEYIEE